MGATYVAIAWRDVATYVAPTGRTVEGLNMTLPRMALRRMSRPPLRLEHTDHVALPLCGVKPAGNLCDLNGLTDAHARVGH